MESATNISGSRIALVTIALFAALLVVIAAAYSTERSFSSVTEMTRARAEARTVRLKLLHLLSLIKDVESGARGYALTDDLQFLAPYSEALAALPEAYARLKNMWPADINETFDWSALDGLFELRMQLAKELIQNRRKSDGEAIEERMLLDAGRVAMDAIRADISRRDQLMALRIDALDAEVRSLHATVARSAWLLSATTILLVSLAFALLLYERKRRLTLEEQLRDSNRQLDQRVIEKTAELAAARDRIAGFAGSQQQVIEDERRRLSREVHDQIGQVFSAIRMIVRALPRGTLPEDQAGVIEEAIDMGVGTARRIAAELRPPLLDDLGLEAAVRHLADRQLAPAGIRVNVRLFDAARLAEPVALTIYRILQEALTNIVRHARADNVEISGVVTDECYRVEVADDGVGISLPLRAGALGIVGMQERAALLGGGVKMENGADGGTFLVVSMPLREGEEVAR